MIEYVIVGLFLLVFVAGLRAGRKNMKGETVKYPGYFNILNIDFWDIKTKEQKNILVNKLVIIMFFYLALTIHFFFLSFVLMYLLINIEFFENGRIR